MVGVMVYFKSNDIGPDELDVGLREEQNQEWFQVF